MTFIKYQLMRILKYKIIAVSVLIISVFACSNTGRDKTQHNDVSLGVDSTSSVPKSNTGAVANKLIPVINDSGQQYFRIVVQKNDKLFAAYEGDFPIGFFDGDNFTLELPASKKMLKISHLLVLYFNGITTGTFPVAASGNEKGKPTMVFTPEQDGNYGISVSPDEGEVIITKYSAKTVSGRITSKGKDIDGNSITIQAEFINVKNNNLDQ
jgi:hypothetical protein